MITLASLQGHFKQKQKKTKNTQLFEPFLYECDFSYYIEITP